MRVPLCGLRTLEEATAPRFVKWQFAAPSPTLPAPLALWEGLSQGIQDFSWKRVASEVPLSSGCAFSELGSEGVLAPV